MILLIIAALTAASGNATTARRLASHLSRRHRVHLIDANQTSLAELKTLVEREQIEACLGLHALLSGPYLHALGLPYALILGGTDLYQQMHPLHQVQMARAVRSAKTIIAFSQQNLHQAGQRWEGISERSVCLPQAVDVSEMDRSFDLHQRLGIDPLCRVVLLPAGIRHIKDPLHLAGAFSLLHQQDPQVVFGIVGPVLEPDFALDVIDTIRKLRGVHYVDGLPRPQMLGAMARASVVLNTSLAEGMSGTILEAMALGVPVVARHNDGNDSLLSHGETGYLYNEPQEAVTYVQELLARPERGVAMAAACKLRLQERHSIEQEFQSYQAILLKICEAGQGTD